MLRPVSAWFSFPENCGARVRESAAARAPRSDRELPDGAPLAVVELRSLQSILAARFWAPAGYRVTPVPDSRGTNGTKASGNPVLGGTAPSWACAVAPLISSERTSDL